MLKMKKIFLLIGLLSIIVFSVISCEDYNKLTAPVLNTGTADFSRFVSIGNSLTMGEQSSSVFEAGQMYSFGNIIARQVGATYAQATFSDPGTGGRLEIASLSPFTLYTNPGQGSPTNLTYPAPYNNLGIKGAFLYDVLNARSANTCYTANFGVPNPLFDAVLRGFGTQLELAIAQQPTFITLWIGNNDILAFATRGGLFPPTDPAVFQTQYSQMLAALNQTGANIVIGALPNALLAPFFTTVGPGVGQAIQGIPGAQGLVYQTTGAPGIAVATPAELINKNVLITLSGSSAAALLGDMTGKYYTDNGIPVPPGVDITKPFGLTPENPFPNNLVLDQTEIAAYQMLNSAYNSIISGLANSYGYSVINWDNLFNQLALSGGLTVNGINFSATYVSGNFFSLDGIHPTSQGYGIIANEFIKAINSKYGAQIPVVNVSTIPGSLVFKDQISMGKYGIPDIPHGALDNILF
jgi:lysophospholipase L1-like esterase